MTARWRRRALFWLILAGAVLVRCAGFPAIPGGINQDEAMAGVDAWALAKYGTDRYGTFLPVHFAAWQYGQMSVLLSYCMVPFLKLFGFGKLAIRLPMLLASCGSVALVYLIGKKLFSVPRAFLLMALTAVNPWHFMQSRWSLDCNLFPHVFLLGFYLLLLGLEKRPFLYISMFFFGLTFYCYGVAVYSVPLFLLGYGLWCVKRRRLRVREVALCGLVFLAAALPEILVMLINFFGWPSIETPLFTMSYFPESVRSHDILFLDFSMGQFWKNAAALVKICFLQCPDALYNALPAFGPLYHLSIPFLAIGLFSGWKRMRRETDPAKKAGQAALWAFFLMGVWVGLATDQVNVNRANILFFPLIFFCGEGIAFVYRKSKAFGWGTLAAYGVCFCLFLSAYFTSFSKEILLLFNDNFLRAVERADGLEGYEALYITSDMDWQDNWQMAEILTQYACRIDAAYYQGKTCISGGRTLRPYAERYHFLWEEEIWQADPEGLYVMHWTQLPKLHFPYEILETEGSYVLLKPRREDG